MKNQQPFFDQPGYDANLKCLDQLRGKAEILSEYWGKLITEPLTAELYEKWLGDRNFVYEKYRLQCIQTMAAAQFDMQSEPVRRPLLDEVPPPYYGMTLQSDPGIVARLNQPQRRDFTPGRFERIHEGAMQYSLPFDRSIRILIHTGMITWTIAGSPTISEETKKSLRLQSTFTPNEKESEIIDSLQKFLNAFGDVKSAGMTRLPINSEGKISFPDLFDMTRSKL